MSSNPLTVDKTMDCITVKEKEFGIISSSLNKNQIWLQQCLIVVVNVARFILGKETYKDI
jgi:hypothetical protein